MSTCTKKYALMHKSLLRNIKMPFRDWILFMSKKKAISIKEDGVIYEHKIGDRNGEFVHLITAHYND